MVSLIEMCIRDRLWSASHIQEQSAPARGLKILVTFVLVWFGWVFFRAPTLSGALHLFARMPDSFSLAPPALKNALAMLGFNSGMLIRVGFACALLCAVDFAARRTGFSAVSYTHLDVYKRQSLCTRRGAEAAAWGCCPAMCWTARC